MLAGGAVAIMGFMSVTAMVLVYAERKIAAHFQCRLGPMRVGWHGTLQSIADALKLFFKEDIVPTNTDKMLHALGPAICVMATLLALIALPLSPTFNIADMNIGVLYLSAVSGLGVLGILLGGWSSNNKWSLLGAMRAGAQIISYEISMTISILVVVLFAGSMKFSTIVQSQVDGWWIWRVPVVGFVAFFIFLISSTAENNRTPFDMAEAESELTAGFHTEYSGLRFAMFFLAEYINLFIVSAVGATLFLGGWMPFHIGNFTTFNAVMDLIPAGVWFALKVAALVFLSMWFRWTFPRLRVDQLMKLEWKVLLPIGLVNLTVGAILVLSELYFFVWNP
ncbi:MAG: NADH-quinone oxidoreductase subunit H [Bdellovibrionales bacterium RBG_16_40_8]|nr:MAG: NADH-quinone oxidoreductase subunit H [Bdellovibrionales bacterium RBG_16_40_8]